MLIFMLLNFNSHAHVERDPNLSFSMYYSYISTHTLTWSVTIRNSWLNAFFFISTHTLTWSVTLSSLTHFNSALFQLTRSRGAWQGTSRLLPAPAQFQLTRSRGAWPALWTWLCRRIDFNSHAHVERDLWSVFHDALEVFISTHTLTWSVTRG